MDGSLLHVVGQCFVRRTFSSDFNDYYTFQISAQFCHVNKEIHPAAGLSLNILIKSCICENHLMSIHLVSKCPIYSPNNSLL